MKKIYVMLFLISMVFLCSCAKKVSDYKYVKWSCDGELEMEFSYLEEDAAHGFYIVNGKREEAFLLLTRSFGFTINRVVDNVSAGENKYSFTGEAKVKKGKTLILKIENDCFDGEYIGKEIELKREDIDKSTVKINMFSSAVFVDEANKLTFTIGRDSRFFGTGTLNEGQIYFEFIDDSEFVMYEIIDSNFYAYEGQKPSEIKKNIDKYIKGTYTSEFKNAKLTVTENTINEMTEFNIVVQ